MSSEIDICNLALAHLGDSANISDFEEGTAQADHCARFYPFARDQLLEKHEWGFATRRETLALLDDDTGTAWSYQYATPGNYIKVFAVLEPEAEDRDGQPFDIETVSSGDTVIHTNVEDAIARYVLRVTDTAKFTPMFTIALSRLLASYLAGPIIKGREGMQVGRDQYSLFMAEFAAAAASDSNGRRVEQAHTPGSIEARGASSSPAWLADGRIIR